MWCIFSSFSPTLLNSLWNNNSFFLSHYTQKPLSLTTGQDVQHLNIINVAHLHTREYVLRICFTFYFFLLQFNVVNSFFLYFISSLFCWFLLLLLLLLLMLVCLFSCETLLLSSVVVNTRVVSRLSTTWS